MPTKKQLSMLKLFREKLIAERASRKKGDVLYCAGAKANDNCLYCTVCVKDKDLISNLFR